MKILFLSMSCRQEFFMNQFEFIKQNWAKDIIDGKYGKDVMFLGYDGWENDFQLDEDNHILHVRCEDDMLSTFKKTYYAFKVLQDKYDFDFIFRTNTSTYVNVPLVLKYIEELDPNTEVIHTGEQVGVFFGAAPYPMDIICRGNSVIYSRKIIDIVLKEGINFLYLNQIDDSTISNIMNSYHIKKGEDYKDFVKCYLHGYYKTCSQDYYAECLTFQIKNLDRTLEDQHFSELHNNITDAYKVLNYDSAMYANQKYSANSYVIISDEISISSYLYNHCNMHELYEFSYNVSVKERMITEKRKHPIFV